MQAILRLFPKKQTMGKENFDSQEHKRKNQDDVPIILSNRRTIYLFDGQTIA
jgi:hypothetical protein